MPRLGSTARQGTRAARRRGGRARPMAGAALSLAVLCGGCSGARGELRPQHRSVLPGVAFEMLRDNPDLVVLDLRPFEEYIAPAGHLERAASAPRMQLDYLWPVLDLSDEDTVLIYDGDGGEAQVDGAQYLIDRGLRFVVQIDGGLRAWLAKGFRVVVEDAPLSPIRPSGSAEAGQSDPG